MLLRSNGNFQRWNLVVSQPVQARAWELYADLGHSWSLSVCFLATVRWAASAPCSHSKRLLYTPQLTQQSLSWNWVQKCSKLFLSGIWYEQRKAHSHREATSHSILQCVSLQLAFMPSALQIILEVGSLILLSMTAKSWKGLKPILPITYDWFDPLAWGLVLFPFSTQHWIENYASQNPRVSVLPALALPFCKSPYLPTKPVLGIIRNYKVDLK